ncbi:hypothetical protein M3586_29610, partial [Priestia megaterium]|nr:hypothetical protein [Priestia megaterium]
DRLAGAVHVGLRLKQMDFLAMQARFRIEAVEAAFVAQRRASFAGELVDQPETGVVARRGVFRPGIAEADDQFDHDVSKAATAAWAQKKKNPPGKPRRVASTVS